MNQRLNSILVLLATMVAFHALHIDPIDANAATGNLLTDGSFEPGPAALHPYFRSAGFDPPWMPGEWNAEAASLITGVNAGITPHSINRMLRVDQTSLVTSQVSQIVDKGSPTTSTMNANFFVWVNSPLNSPVATGIQVYAGAAQTIVGTIDPLGGAFATVAVPFVTDGDPNTWEQISGTLPLLIGTQYLDFELFASNATIPPEGVFFDTACLSCVPEPNSFALLMCWALSTVGLPSFSRRRGATRGRHGETRIS